jgi:hypothetical protein
MLRDAAPGGAMFQIAKISFDAGTLLLPANDPYDREVVFEQADFYARRHGSVAVQIGRAQIRAARSSEPGEVCARCHEPLRSVSFEVGESRFCTQCTKRAARHAAELRTPH